MKRKLILLLLFLLIGIFTFTLAFAPKRIELFGKIFLSNSTELKLNDVNVNSISNLTKELVNFTDLKKVDFGKNYIKIDDYNELIKKYPKVHFNALKIYNIYNEDIKEDALAIDFNNTKVDDKLIDYLVLFPKLKKVNLSNQELSLDEELDLMNRYSNIDFLFNVPIGSKKVLSNVSKLELEKETIDDVDSFYKSLKVLSKLTYLKLGYSNLSNDVLGKMQKDFPNIKISWTIKIGVWHINTDDVAFSVLISNFPYKRLTSADLEFLKYCPDLQALDLGHQRITDLNVIVDNLPNLRVLILADNKISDLTPLKKLQHLHYLELFINDITDISPLEANKELVDVNLCFNRITSIESLENLPKLERVWLVGTRVPDKIANDFTYRHKSIELVRHGIGSTGNGWRTHERYDSMIDMFHKRNYISENFSKFG